MFPTDPHNILTVIYFFGLYISSSGITASNSSFRFCPQSSNAISLVEGFISFPVKEWRTVLQSKFDCYFHLRSLPSSKLVLRFSELKLNSRMPQCQHDYLEIFVGCRENSIGRFCTGNSKIPHLVYSNDHCIKLHFHWSGRQNQDQIGWQGFRAYYFSVDHVALKMQAFIVLLSLKTRMKGTVFSSGWPIKYKHGVSKSWMIKVPPRCGTKIAVMDVDFGVKANVGTGTCLQISAFDSVSKSETSMAICSSTRPFYKIYDQSYDQLSLNFTSNRHGNTVGRGVLVGYVHFCRNEVIKDVKVPLSRSHLKDGDRHLKIVIPSSLAIMIVLLSVSIKIFFYQRRLPRAESTVNVESSEDDSTEQSQRSVTEKDTKTNEQHFDQPIDSSTTPSSDLKAATEVEERNSKYCYLVQVQSRNEILNLQEMLSEFIYGHSGSTGSIPKVAIHKEKTEEGPLKLGWLFKEGQHHKKLTVRFVEATHSTANNDNNEITYVFACEQSDSICSDKITSPIPKFNGGCSDTTLQFGSMGLSQADDCGSTSKRAKLNTVTPGENSKLNKCWEFPVENEDRKPTKKQIESLV